MEIKAAIEQEDAASRARRQALEKELRELEADATGGFDSPGVYLEGEMTLGCVLTLVWSQALRLSRCACTGAWGRPPWRFCGGS